MNCCIESASVSQKDAIWQYMQEHGQITPMDALREFGCFRLGARIWDLERDGKMISHGMGRAGGKSFAVYKPIKCDPSGQLSLL